MRSPWTAFRRAGRVSGLLLLATGLIPGEADAQRPSATLNPVTTTDMYGNARPAARERRLMGLYQNSAQWGALRGFQSAGRRVNRRGGMIPFAFAADRPWRRPTRRQTALPSFAAGSLGTVSPSVHRAFSRYGGFGTRLAGQEANDIATILDRRTALIQATSLNAPVHRAIWDLGSSGGLVTPIPYGPPAHSGAEEPSPAALTLDQALHQRAARSHLRSRANGWARFTEGHYRRAARAFETATLMQPADVESRIGELFCHMSLGAMRTSASLLEQLARRDPNPFLHDINVIERYADADQARQARLRAQLWAQAGDHVTSAQALQMFVLWYLGERDEAVGVGVGLSRGLSGSIYADWPEKMTEARTVVNRAVEEP